VAELGQHPPDLAILSFSENELEDGRVAPLPDRLDPLGSNLSFGEPDPFGQLAEDLAGRRTGHDDPVKLLDAVFGVSELVGEFAVVGQQQEPDAHLVEPADGIDALGDLGQEVENSRSTRRVVVRRDVPFWLVDREVDRALDLDLLAVDRDRGPGEVNLRPEFADDLAVDRHPALEDQILASPSRPDPRVSQDLLKPLGADEFTGTLGE
jgi:hypothetical protein